MKTKNNQERSSYPMDYIENKELYAAVMFARKMMKEGTSVGLACYRAATYYGFTTGQVAHYIAQRGGRSNANRKH